MPAYAVMTAGCKSTSKGMVAGLTNVGQDLLAARLLLILCQLVLEGGAVLGVALRLLLLLLQPFLWSHSKFEYTTDRMPTSASSASLDRTIL